MMKLMASVLPLVSHCDVMKLMDELKARRALVTVLPRRSRLTWVWRRAELNSSTEIALRSPRSS